MWLQFKAASWQGEEPPRHFFNRRSRFASITFDAIDADGVRFASGPVFRLPLPEITSGTTVLLARIAEFCARADALMHEAKASGRNRLAYERMTVFSAAPPQGRGRERNAA